MAASSFTPSTFRIAISILLLVAIGTAFIFLPVEQAIPLSHTIHSYSHFECICSFSDSVATKLKDFLLWIKEDLGPFGPLALALAYIPLTIVAVPASVLTLGGGYLFGLPVGFVADSLGATLGATAAFLLGRTIGKSYVTSKIKHYPKFQAVSAAIQRSGFKIVLLLRVVPILPFNMLNYLLSVTPVRLGEYMLATWLGMMRHTNLAKVEGLRARPWLKPGSYANGDQYDYDGDEDDHSRPWWRRRLRSLYMAASSFTPSTFRIAISLLLLVAIGTAFIFLPVEQKLKDFLLWIKEDLGPFGPLALALAYIPLTIVAVPASVLTLGGGYLFGLPVGFVADSLGATLGATAAFLLGRTIGKSYVTSKIKHYPKFQAVSVAIQRSGFKIVLLLRVVPILPFNMLNYLLSVTPVRLGEYMLATWLGMMVLTFL
ncbi:hypothetical protein F2Q70_00042169 [Brassica cretica]|uniref:VTT domain-containing protein n=1 Tax=Brassica cretica TaxID=69181 RepID=A0A8S9KAX2_BRACR|nr:hypothetical protein F2Q70_00042169 [Brassica cretica]